MTQRNRERRCFYQLNDRRLRILDLTLASRFIVNEQYACAGCRQQLSTMWHRCPKPVNVVVSTTSSAWVEGIGGLFLTALDAGLAELLRPHFRGIVTGHVFLDPGDGSLQPTRFVTAAAPANQRVQSDRGRYCRHMVYGCCGVYANKIGWAGGAIVERTLDDRLVSVDQDGNILIADELVKALDLRKRFPKLWLYRVDVVPEPLDGEILPGDSDWDGSFRPAPEPEMPPEAPGRGRVTLG